MRLIGFMKKHFIIIGTALMTVAIISACGTKENNNGVLINGVCWATCDVDMPETFTENPEGKGMCYQWGMREPINPDSDNIWKDKYESTKWRKPDDPCPEGWRIPTMFEWATLLDLEKVTQKWTGKNISIGMEFTDVKNGNNIYFPAYGYYFVSQDETLLSPKEMEGAYWSSIGVDEETAYFMAFQDNIAVLLFNFDDTNYAFRIRCVRE